MKSIYLDSRYPQPIDGGSGTTFDQNHELIDYLPNTSLRIWYSSYNQFYPSHWHEAMEIIYCESGYYVMCDEEKTWEIHPGDILFIPAGNTHSLNMHENCHGFVYFINLDILKHMPSASNILSFIAQPIFLTKSKLTLYKSVAALLEQMRDEYFSDNDLRELLVYSHMLVLLTQIGRSYLTKSRDLIHLRPDKQKEYMEKFNEVLNYINDNFMENITLELISKKFGFSKFHFSRLFSKYTTYTFSDYLTFRRIKSAEQLLLKSEMTVTEVSTYVGFNSLSTFSRCFKQKNHCSPSDYRCLHNNHNSGITSNMLT